VKFLLQTQIGIEKITELELSKKFKGRYSLDYIGFVPHKNGLLQLEWRSPEGGSPQKIKPKISSFWNELGTVEDAFFILDYIKDINPNATLKEIFLKLNPKEIKTKLDYFFDNLNSFGNNADFRFVTRKKSPHDFRRMDLNTEIKRYFDRNINRANVSDQEGIKEIWTTLIKNRLIIGVRLTTKSKRHSSYKVASVHGSLRPTIANAMAFVTDIHAKDVILDPFCGAGTIACEICENFKFKKIICSDISEEAIKATKSNLEATNSYKKLKGKVSIRKEDFFESKNYGDLIITNLPFGAQYSIDENFITEFFNKADEIKNLRQVTILFHSTIQVPGWQMTRKFELQVLGKNCFAMVFRRLKFKLHDNSMNKNFEDI
jgi:tRNA G10  N-methylase Trm11